MTSSTPNSTDDGRLFPPAILLVTCLGVVLRGVDAARKSLWIDEFHTLFFARAESVAELIERVKFDFHPPGYFLGIHCLEFLPGEVLRWTSIFVSLATLAPLLAICRAGGISARARLVVAAVFAFAPYQVLYGSELRAYPFLQFVAVGLTWAAFTKDRSPRSRFALFAILTAVGLYLHYFTSIVVLAIGVARILVKSPGWLRWTTVFFAGCVGVAAFFPWILIDESWILSEPGVMFRPEAQDTATAEAAAHAWHLRSSDLIKAVVLVPRTFVPMLQSLGPVGAPIAQVGSAIFFFFLLCCLPKFLRTLRSDKPQATIVGAMATCAAAYGIVLAFSLYLWQRIPEQYFMTCAWAWPIAAGVLVARMGDRLQSIAVVALLAGAFIAGTGHVLGNAREDFREGVRVAQMLGKDRNATFTGVLSQPPWFSDLLPYVEYAPDLECFEPLELPADADTVIILTRKNSINVQARKWEPILRGRKFEESYSVDGSVWVYVYVRP